MARKVRIDGLGSAMAGILGEYSNYVSVETKKAIKKAGTAAAKELRASSPKDSGDYAKSWKSTVVSETANTIHVSVHAGGHQYSLTHLLENGHAKRGGGRVAAIVHIAPVNSRAVEQVERMIEKSL